ncbi:hypothetical protein [Cylindrospermum sp. FACHB-282]|uniref:hypothetical protein n=1 Tax=Cylindrospermum sp. FACHB-282 TaxID=2692794 RepID=UPI001684B15D|nr:hypothetical protein [Cylindrospermum sp. FACHB-282]MBD2388455.1 hypothetical protein [Cylindrospermum sp. FACHB-282]
MKKNTPWGQFLAFAQERSPQWNCLLFSTRGCANERLREQHWVERHRRTTFCHQTPKNRCLNKLYTHRLAPPNTKPTGESESPISPILSFSVEGNSCQP